MLGDPAAAAHTPDAVLKNMAAAYRHAKTYADSGRLRFRMLRGEENLDESADFSVTFERPNRLRMHLYQGIVVSDGQKLYATVGDLEGQVLEADAPEQLTLDSLAADEVLSGVLNEGVAGPSPQLGLLLSDDALDGILTGAKSSKLLEPKGIDGRTCVGIDIEREDGHLVFWIDRENHVVRRIEFPTEALRQAIGDNEIKELAMWADLSGAVLDSKIDDVAFRFETPEGAKLVQQFDTRPLMPKPPEPSKLLGQKVPDFKFTALDGGSDVTLESLAGQVVVIDFWATWCGPCLESLPNLNEVYQKYKDREGVRFLAVSIDAESVTPAQIKETFQKIGVSLPIYRDTLTAARDAFGVEGIPNLFVLGPDGTVEDNDVGFNPRLAAELPGKIEKLLSGKSIYEDALKQYQQRLSEYEAAMAAPLGEGSGGPIRAEIATQTEPEHLQLTEAWTSKDIQEPGNILIVESEVGPTRLLVNDGWKGITELSTDGAVLGKHQPEIPDSAVISFIRTAVDAEGKRLFAVAATTQPQAYLFDENWKLLLGYPQEEGREVADVELGDLDGDNQIDLITSFWGAGGVDAVTKEGRVLFTNTGLENPFRVALSSPDPSGHRHLLCANSRGTIQPIDHTGSSGAEVAVGKRFLRYVVAEDLDGDGQAELCGIAATTAGGETLVGFAEDGTELWSYPLPPGLHQQPIEMITAGDMAAGARHWIVAGADGSLHFLAADGTLLDKFCTGATLTGVAAATVDGQPMLFIGTTDGLIAWKVDANELSLGAGLGSRVILDR